jgi:hypothetical protein
MTVAGLDRDAASVPQIAVSTTRGGATANSDDVSPRVRAMRATRRGVGHARCDRRAGPGPSAGANEAAVDVEPVYHAKVRIGRRTIYTNHDGAATIKIERRHRVTITAGDILKPALANLR